MLSSSFNNAAGTCAYQPAGYVQVTWLPTGTRLADVMALYEHLLALLRHHHCHRILSDHRQRPAYGQALQAWVVDDFMPRLEAVTGRGCYAVVQAEEVISRLAGRSLTARLGAGISHRTFGTAAEAEDWLLH